MRQHPTLVYCPKCFTARPFVHKHDPFLLSVLRWFGLAMLRPFRR